MRRLLGLLLLRCVVLRGEARAVIFAEDVVPAATLLLPYFEVALDDPNKVTTVFTVANADRAPHLAHVTLWTDLGVPSFAFDVYLAGYDMLEVDLRLVLEGILPQTSSTLAQQGTHSDPPVAFPACEALGTQGRLPAATVADLRNAHTGQASGLWGGLCGGRPIGDNLARGYVTVDVVNRCSNKFPGDPAGGADPAYFVQLGAGIASNANVLWGEFWMAERANAFAYGDALVHIEANGPPFPGSFTFYGRRVNGSMADNREPLSSVHFARYLKGGVFDSGTHLLVWRDPGFVLPFGCGSTLPRLQQKEVTPFNEEEDLTDLTMGLPVGFQTRMPWAAERVNVGDDARLPIPYDSGFLYLDLDFPSAVTDPLFNRRNQSFVVSVFRAANRFAGAQRAYIQRLTNVNMHPVP